MRRVSTETKDSAFLAAIVEENFSRQKLFGLLPGIQLPVSRTFNVRTFNATNAAKTVQNCFHLQLSTYAEVFHLYIVQWSKAMNDG